MRISSELLKHIIYYGTALALLVGGWFVFSTAFGSAVDSAGGLGQRFVTIGGVIVGCGLILGAAVLLAFPLSGLLSAPWGNFLFPNAKFDRPQPLYSLAEAQARREEYEKAMSTYEGIADDFPEEVRPWIGMVEIAVTALQDVNRADSIYQRGMEQLTNVEAQETFTRMYRGIRSRLDEEPEWGKKRTIDLVPKPRRRPHRNR